jgi:hypothetical protein
MIFNFLDQHRWWFIATMAAIAGIATGAFILGFAPEASALYTRDASLASGIAAIATAIYFLASSHATRFWELFRLRWQVRRRESLLQEVAQKLEQCEKDSMRWRDAQPVGLEMKDVLEMATEQERTSLQTLTLARSTAPKDLEQRVRQLGTPIHEEWMRRFRGVIAFRDYDVVVRNAASGMDVAIDKGYSPAELEAAVMRRIFAGRLAILAPDERDRVLTAWRHFADEHRDSLSDNVPAESPNDETELAGAGTYCMATVVAGAVVHERGLTLPTTFFQGVSAMLPPLIGALGWRITATATVRFLKYWHVRRVLPAIVLVSRMRAGTRVRRISHLEKLEVERSNLRRTSEFVLSQLAELKELQEHLSQLKFSMRRLRMVLPLA